jgi:hypothetical protein
MKNTLIKLMKHPIEKPVNKIIDIAGRTIQNEGIKNDALKELEKNDLFYAGILRMNYKLISENERLRKKMNIIIKDYNKLDKRNNKNEELIQKYRIWKKKRNVKFKRWFFKRKKEKLKKMKINIKEKSNVRKKKK